MADIRFPLDVNRTGKEGAKILVADAFDEISYMKAEDFVGDKGDKGDTGATGATGATGQTGATGATGNKGWSPDFRVETYTLAGVERAVQKLIGWVGGEGAAPTDNVGLYLKGDGTFTANRDLAANFKGSKGEKGDQGDGSNITVSANSLVGNDTTASSSHKSLAPVGLTLYDGKVYNAVGYQNIILVGKANKTSLYYGGGEQTGAFKIKIPTLTSEAMYSIFGTIRQYDDNSAVNRSGAFIITFYTYAGFSRNLSATFIGANIPNYPVRFFEDGDAKYIAIGELTQSWSYLGFSIDNVQVCHGGATMEVMGSDWVVSIISSFTGIMGGIVINALPKSNQSQTLESIPVMPAIPIVAGDTKAERDGKFQAQLNDRLRKQESLSLLSPADYYHSDSLLGGILIRTDIYTSQDSMFILRITGNNYSSEPPVLITLQGYSYSTPKKYINVSAVSNGKWVNGQIRVVNINGFTCFWLSTVFYKSYFFEAYSYFSRVNHITEIVRLDVPPEGDDPVLYTFVDVTPVQSLFNDGSSDVLIKGDGVYKPLSDFQMAEAGKGLSEANYTAGEKTKLAGLESSKFKGQFVSLAALIAAGVGGVGNYAYVDAGAGSAVKTYVWDTSDNSWELQNGIPNAETPASIKSKYESNSDTNAFTDAEKTKLNGIPTFQKGSFVVDSTFVSVLHKDISLPGASVGDFVLIRESAARLPDKVFNFSAQIVSADTMRVFINYVVLDGVSNSPYFPATLPPGTVGSTINFLLLKF